MPLEEQTEDSNPFVPPLEFTLCERGFFLQGQKTKPFS